MPEGNNLKIRYTAASELPGQYRQLAEYFANPHSLIYGPLDRFYDFLQGDMRLGEDERLHDTPSSCACFVCRAKAGHTPTFVVPLSGHSRPGEVVWANHYVATDAQGRHIAADTPCVGLDRNGCPCYWCSPYHHDPLTTNRQALKRLVSFIRPLVPEVRGLRLERERATLLANLARVEREMQNTIYQPTLLA